MVAPRFSNPEGGLAEIVEKAIARMGNALVKESGRIQCMIQAGFFRSKGQRSSGIDVGKMQANNCYVLLEKPNILF